MNLAINFNAVSSSDYAGNAIADTIVYGDPLMDTLDGATDAWSAHVQSEDLSGSNAFDLSALTTRRGAALAIAQLRAIIIANRSEACPIVLQSVTIPDLLTGNLTCPPKSRLVLQASADFPWFVAAGQGFTVSFSGSQPPTYDLILAGSV
jgi:hypothetical protein